MMEQSTGINETYANNLNLKITNTSNSIYQMTDQNEANIISQQPSEAVRPFEESVQMMSPPQLDMRMQSTLYQQSALYQGQSNMINVTDETVNNKNFQRQQEQIENLKQQMLLQQHVQNQQQRLDQTVFPDQAAQISHIEDQLAMEAHAIQILQNERNRQELGELMDQQIQNENRDQMMAKENNYVHDAINNEAKNFKEHIQTAPLSNQQDNSNKSSVMRSKVGSKKHSRRASQDTGLFFVLKPKELQGPGGKKNQHDEPVQQSYSLKQNGYGTLFENYTLQSTGNTHELKPRINNSRFYQVQAHKIKAKHQTLHSAEQFNGQIKRGGILRSAIGVSTSQGGGRAVVDGHQGIQNIKISNSSSVNSPNAFYGHHNKVPQETALITKGQKMIMKNQNSNEQGVKSIRYGRDFIDVNQYNHGDKYSTPTRMINQNQQASPRPQKMMQKANQLAKNFQKTNQQLDNIMQNSGAAAEYNSYVNQNSEQLGQFHPGLPGRTMALTGQSVETRSFTAALPRSNNNDIIKRNKTRVDVLRKRTDKIDPKLQADQMYSQIMESKQHVSAERIQRLALFDNNADQLLTFQQKSLGYVNDPSNDLVRLNRDVVPSSESVPHYTTFKNIQQNFAQNYIMNQQMKLQQQFELLHQLQNQDAMIDMQMYENVQYSQHSQMQVEKEQQQLPTTSNEFSSYDQSQRLRNQYQNQQGVPQLGSLHQQTMKSQRPPSNLATSFEQNADLKSQDPGAPVRQETLVTVEDAIQMSHDQIKIEVNNDQKERFPVPVRSLMNGQQVLVSGDFGSLKKFKQTFSTLDPQQPKDGLEAGKAQHKLPASKISTLEQVDPEMILTAESKENEIKIDDLTNQINTVERVQSSSKSKMEEDNQDHDYVASESARETYKKDFTFQAGSINNLATDGTKQALKEADYIDDVNITQEKAAKAEIKSNRTVAEGKMDLIEVTSPTISKAGDNTSNTGGQEVMLREATAEETKNIVQSSGTTSSPLENKDRSEQINIDVKTKPVLNFKRIQENGDMNNQNQNQKVEQGQQLQDQQKQGTPTKTLNIMVNDTEVLNTLVQSPQDSFSDAFATHQKELMKISDDVGKHIQDPNKLSNIIPLSLGSTLEGNVGNAIRGLDPAHQRFSINHVMQQNIPSITSSLEKPTQQLQPMMYDPVHEHSPMNTLVFPSSHLQMNVVNDFSHPPKFRRQILETGMYQKPKIYKSVRVGNNKNKAYNIYQRLCPGTNNSSATSQGYNRNGWRDLTTGNKTIKLNQKLKNTGTLKTKINFTESHTRSIPQKSVNKSVQQMVMSRTNNDAKQTATNSTHMMFSERDYYSSDIQNLNNEGSTIISNRKAMRFNIEKSKWSATDRRFKQTSFNDFQKNSVALKNRAQSSHYTTTRNRAVFTHQIANSSLPISSPKQEQIEQDTGYQLMQQKAPGGQNPDYAQIYRESQMSAAHSKAAGGPIHVKNAPATSSLEIDSESMRLLRHESIKSHQEKRMSPFRAETQKQFENLMVKKGIQRQKKSIIHSAKYSRMQKRSTLIQPSVMNLNSQNQYYTQVAPQEPRTVVSKLLTNNQRFKVVQQIALKQYLGSRDQSAILLGQEHPQDAMDDSQGSSQARLQHQQNLENNYNISFNLNEGFSGQQAIEDIKLQKEEQAKPKTDKLDKSVQKLISNLRSGSAVLSERRNQETGRGGQKPDPALDILKTFSQTIINKQQNKRKGSSPLQRQESDDDDMDLDDEDFAPRNKYEKSQRSSGCLETQEEVQLDIQRHLYHVIKNKVSKKVQKEFMRNVRRDIKQSANGVPNVGLYSYATRYTIKPRPEDFLKQSNLRSQNLATKVFQSRNDDPVIQHIDPHNNFVEFDKQEDRPDLIKQLVPTDLEARAIEPHPDYIAVDPKKWIRQTTLNFDNQISRDTHFPGQIKHCQEDQISDEEYLIRQIAQKYSRKFNSINACKTE